MEVKRVIKENSRRALYHRDGTEFEDLIFVDSKTGKYKVSQISEISTVRPTKNMSKMIRESDPYSIIGIHNHPNSTLPSGEDLYQCSKRKYKYGLVLGHDGSVYNYTVPKKFNESAARIYNILFDKDYKKGYNISEFLQKIKRTLGVEIEVL